MRSSDLACDLPASGREACSGHLKLQRKAPTTNSNLTIRTYINHTWERCTIRMGLMSPSISRTSLWSPIDLAILRALQTPAAKTFLQARRAYSSGPAKAERRLPNSPAPVHIRAWQRNFVIGLVTGSICVAGYLYYKERKYRDAFVLYKIVSKEPVSSTASIFKLEPQEPSENFEIYKEVWRRGIWNVHFKQPQIQIVRPYTPLPPLEGASKEEENRLRFLIRKDPFGEVSSYLHSLPIGANIELRGPNLEYELSPEVKQVVFFAGGTGVAPALQVAHALFEASSKRQERKLHILWANRKREDCMGGSSDAPPAEPVPPKPYWSGFFTKQKPKPAVPAGPERGVIVQELEDLKAKYPGQVTVEYFVNDEDTWIDRDAVFKALSRFDDRDFSLGSATAQEQRQILISGPSGFISYLAGPKEWRGGRQEQGGVSKIIAHAISMNPHNVKVWKI